MDNSILYIVITALVTFIFTQAGNILFYQHQRQNLNKDAKVGLAESIRLQFTQLLPRLEEFHTQLTDYHNNRIEQKPAISSLGWASIKGNLLLLRAKDPVLFKLMENISSFDSDLKQSTELDKLLIQAKQFCQNRIALQGGEIIREYKL